MLYFQLWFIDGNISKHPSCSLFILTKHFFVLRQPSLSSCTAHFRLFFAEVSSHTCMPLYHFASPFSSQSRNIHALFAIRREYLLFLYFFYHSIESYICVSFWVAIKRSLFMTKRLHNNPRVFLYLSIFSHGSFDLAPLLLRSPTPWPHTASKTKVPAGSWRCLKCR